MTENTVLLSLARYNELRDFYNGIKEGKFMVVDSYCNNIYYLEEKEVIQSLKNDLRKLQKEYYALKRPDEKTIDDVKKMSLWQFLKWRNKHN